MGAGLGPKINSKTKNFWLKALPGSGSLVASINKGHKKFENWNLSKKPRSKILVSENESRNGLWEIQFTHIYISKQKIEYILSHRNSENVVSTSGRSTLEKGDTK